MHTTIEYLALAVVLAAYGLLPFVGPNLLGG